MSNRIKKYLIINYIKKNKISKKEFCKRAGIGYDLLKKVLKDQSNFRANAVFKIAKELNLEVYQLFF